MTTTLLILLLIFQLKHFIADYPLQNEYMLGKFKDKGWILPLLTHCLVQLVFTFTISLIYSNSLILALKLSIFDLTIHFIMDRIKASPKMLGRFEALTKRDFIEYQNDLRASFEMYKHTITKPFEKRKRSNKLFWWSLGLDQMIHHITDILIIYFLVK